MQKQEGALNKRSLGKKYEQMAAAYLQDKGYHILYHNFQCRLGEIDIIARHNAYLIFVEVKYRKRKDYGYPREAVNFKKQQHIIRTAAYYLLTHVGVEVPCRFDVIEILEEQITHIEAAF